jgi:dimethylhistidine N-methyltransferase
MKEAHLVHDLAPPSTSFVNDVLTGLSRMQKTLPPKLLYDKLGSEIFEEICELEEYYPTRTEKLILDTFAPEMCELMGENVLLIEPGSGAGEKVRHLLPHLKHPKAYVPIEISREILLRMTDELHQEFPELTVRPVCSDFTADLELPLTVESQRGKKVIFFPGSTIGNFNPVEAIRFLQRYTAMLGNEGGFLIGADLKKEPSILERAYDDAKGVTARFNLNLLERINREAGGTFEVDHFEHEARYNEEYGRVEMHLKSKVPQLVRVNETIFRFHAGETIHTENSYKYSVDEFIALCGKAGLSLKRFWKDPENLFCMYYFEKE